MATVPTEEHLKALIDKMCEIINAERVKLNLNPIYCVPYLMDCAETRAWEASDVWGHIRPDGTHFTSIIDWDTAQWKNIFENLTAGYDTAESAMESFRNSPNHWAAITHPDITHMGVGLVYNPEGFGGCEYYWSQIFLQDQRGADYEYPGQYLPGESELYPGTLKLSLIDTETGKIIPNMTVTVTQTNEAKRDLSDVKITQNGRSLDWATDSFMFDSKKEKFLFDTVDCPQLPSGDYLITNCPSGNYLITISGTATNYYIPQNHYSGGKITANFTMKNDGSEIPNITFEFIVRKFSILKKDSATGSPLAGAKLEISCSSNMSKCESSYPFEKIDNFKISYTTGDTAVVFSKIPDSTYTITEVETPSSSYIKAEKAVFKIHENEIQLVEEENKGGVVEDNKLIIYDKKRILTIHPIAYENSIRVYDLSEPQDGFKHNGKAILRPISCTSYKNSDIWDVELVHHVDEWGKWKYLLPENVLKVNGQLFRIDIVETECGEDGATVSVHARHISYDMNDMIIENAEFDGGNAQDFIDFCMINSYFDYGGDEEHNLFYKEYEFAVTSDISTILKGDKYVNISVMGALIGTDNCLVNRYGGEIYRDNFRVSINEKMENSRENAFYLRYGANVSGIKQRIDYTDFCTWLGCTNNFGDVLAVSFTGDSRWAFHHRRRRFHTLNYADSATAANQFGGDVSRLFGTESSPQVSYTIKLNTLKKDPRFADFSNLLNCDYGDTGTIYCPELNINTKQKVVGIERDEIANEIITIELGNVENSLIRPDFMGNTVTTGHSLFDRLRR